MPLKQIRRQLMEFYQSQEIPEFDHANLLIMEG